MNFLVTLRYLVFAVFIVCNAILASVAVWNASLVSPRGRDTRIDTYLVVIGALGLALTFAIIFVELVRRNAFTSRIWFETLWTAIFFLLDLAGAATLTAVGPDDMCTPSKHGKALPPGSCVSSRVLIGFTWLCTLILLIYLVLLLLLTIINRNNDQVPRIWECTIYNFPPLTAPRSNAPALPFSKDKMTEVVTPPPQRPNTVPSALYSMRSIGLGSQYQIEHFRPPPHSSGPAIPAAIPVASPADYLHRAPSNAGTVQAAVALYPQFLSSAYVSQPPPAHMQPTRPVNRSPPPLGDWPRADAPLRIKRKAPPTMGAGAGQTDTAARPLGPRTRSGTSGHSAASTRLDLAPHAQRSRGE
ncbi:hypothetical protein B0H16DRAFT_1508015 [Mycena metata]|uniref:MARVEL domain-containing protein n=1 Tax=Mycena metata TaxID=1033252 RepID=A0AAD7JYN4_9AGAR|nr:hypothetical protein B0H16DRAFT_1508015 [Mycena metata]